MTERTYPPVGPGLIDIVVFESNGTFTKADYPQARSFRVHSVGGGGGGAGCGGANGDVGGGGGGAAYASSFLLASELTDSVTVTVGGGGSGGATGANNGSDGTDSSFGSLVVADAGGGGIDALNGAQPNNNDGSPGLAANSTGDITMDGEPGSTLLPGGGLSGLVKGGNGGAAAGPYGGGMRRGQVLANGGALDGQTGVKYGGGGGGAVDDGGGTKAGGDGADGVVIVEVYA